MEHTNYILITPILTIPDPDEQLIEFDTRFEPFFFAGQDNGLYYPNEEIDDYMYFILEECDRRWGSDWQGILVQDNTVAYGNGMPGQPEGCDDKVVYFKT